MRVVKFKLHAMVILEYCYLRKLSRLLLSFFLSSSILDIKVEDHDKKQTIGCQY